MTLKDFKVLSVEGGRVQGKKIFRDLGIMFEKAEICQNTGSQPGFEILIFLKHLLNIF